MTKEQFLEILETETEHEKDYKPTKPCDEALRGLNVMAKYIKGNVIMGADHDVIYSVEVQVLVDAGITEEDVVTIRNSMWWSEDGDYLQHFV